MTLECHAELAKCYKKVLPPENLVSIFEELEVTRRAEVEAQRAREKAPNKRVSGAGQPGRSAPVAVSVRQ